MQQFTKNILQGLKVDLAEAFDRNFEHKSFFGEPWDKAILQNNKGSLLIRTGALRRSIRANIQGTNIIFTSSLPYALLQNEGGQIKVTLKMKRYFWYKYLETTSKGSKATGKRKQNLSIEAQQYKAMALKKVGSTITVKSRRFIGDHPKIKTIVEDVVTRHLPELEQYIKNLFRL